jgi:hypothetical protein
MPNNKNFRQKYLLPITYCGVMVFALWGATGLVSVMAPKSNNIISFENLEPAAGDEATPTTATASDLKGAQELPPIPTADPVTAPTTDAAEEAPLRISSDKPEVIKLDRDAVNVLVGSDETLRAVPDTNRTIVLIPKKPGATYFRAIDAEGKVIMQRHVIVGAVEKGNNYIRIRRACAGDDAKCKEFSVYYCPDMCHEVNVVQGDSSNSSTNRAPDVAPSTSTPDTNTEYVEPPVPTPAPTPAQAPAQ